MTSREHGTSAVVGHRLRPPVPPAVHLSREGLVRRVLALRPAGICLVDAPPGYGSSTLLADIAAAHEGPVAWVSAPGEPRTVVWEHVLAALDGVGVAVADARAALAGPPAPFRAELLNALAATDRVLLVLDDLDSLRHPDLVPDLQVLVDSLPSTTRVVLRLEHDGVALRRAATTGRALHLGVSELTLSDHDARALVRLLDPALPADRADALLALAAGWVAALVAPYAPGARDPADDPAAWLVSAGAAPLAAVLVDGLPTSERELVTRIAVTDTVTPELAARLAGCSDEQAAASIARLRRWGLLTRPQHAAGAVALHPLVADYARGQAELHGPHELAGLHRIAAEWLLERGEVSRAIDHVLAAGDLPWALSILAGSVGGLLESGHAEQVHGWYERAPDVLVTEQHLHLLASAWSELLSGNPAGAEQRCHRLVATLEAVDDAASTLGVGTGDESGLSLLQAETSLLQASLAWWGGRPDESRRRADAAAAVFGDRWARVAHQATAMYRIRARLWSGDASSARGLLLEASGRAGTHDLLRRVVFPGLQAALTVREGRVRHGRAVAQAAVDAARGSSMASVFDDADARLALALAQLDLGDTESALGVAAGLAAQAGTSGHLTYGVLASGVQAWALHRLGRAHEAQDVLGQTRALLASSAGEPALGRLLDAAELRMCVESGARQRSLVLLRRLPAGPDTELLAARLAPRGSEQAIRRLRGFRPRDVRQSVEAQLVLAGALAPVRPREAEQHLRRAADSALSAGLLTALRGHPEELQVLAARVAEHGDGGAVAALLAAAHSAPAADPPVPLAPAVRLTQGEQHLLVTMRSHRSQRDLAAALGVSVNTVKTRLRRLYRKLGVNDRESALAAVDAPGAAPPPSRSPT